MATGTNPSGGTPSDPRELIFESDRESQPTHVRKKEWWFFPVRILFSLTTGGLLAWAYRQAAELATERFGPVFPGWTYYLMLAAFFLTGFGGMYYWLRKA